MTHNDRDGKIKEALQEYLQDVEGETEFREAVVGSYLDGEIEFETLEAFVGRRDAESVRASKTLLEGGEDLAADLADY